MYFKVVFPVLAVLLAVASASLVGGPVEADASDQDAQDALQFAVAQYNRKSNDAFVRQVSEVISVKKQVVAGMKYIFEVKMGRTGCKKSGVETLCAVHEDPSFAQVTPCKIEVWSRPWLKSIKVVKNTCP